MWGHDFNLVVVNIKEDTCISSHRSTKGWHPAREVFLEDMVMQLSYTAKLLVGTC